MKKQWRYYTIFISSTFKDMDEERDVIKLDVVKRLNRAYQDKFIRFQTVDLRVGINTIDIATEEERENRVLDVCFSSIDGARPFFIGLLGERYGWVPDADKWKYVISRLSEERRPLLKDSQNCSVTELEILYGAIGNDGEYMNHSLFFMRDSSSYDLMPSDIKPTYCDIANSALSEEMRSTYSHKLQSLKERIIALCNQMHLEKNCFYYTLQWDVKGDHFNGLDSFANLLFDKISREVDQELTSEHLENYTWYSQEDLNVEYLHKKNIYRKVKRTAFKEIIDTIEQGKQVLLIGSEGMGKTVLLSQLYEHFSNDSDVLCLSAFVGMSHYSISIRSIIVRWILYLAQVLEVTLPDDEALMNEKKTKLLSLYNQFGTLVAEAKLQGKQVCICLDDIQLFELQNKEDAYLPWLSKNVIFVGTVTPDFAEKVTRYNKDLQSITLLQLAMDELQNILENEERKCMIELPVEIKQDLMTRSVTPLQLGMIMTLLTHLCTNDFRKIRKEGGGSEIEKINRYMYQLYASTPDNHSELFLFIIRFFMKNLRVSEDLMQMFTYIAISGNGLRESDLEKLMPEHWNLLDFHTLVYILDDFFVEDRVSHNWRIKSFSLASSLIPDDVASKKLYTHLASTILALEDNDPKKNDMLFYYLIRAHHINGIQETMIADDSERIKERYLVSIQYLLRNSSLEEDFVSIISQLSPGQAINFVYHLIIHGIPQFGYPELLWQMINHNLLQINPEQLNVGDSYNLATLFREVYLLSKYNRIKCEPEDVDRILISCVAAYEHCYKTDLTHRDSRNMLKAMLTEEITMYVRIGRTEKIQEILLLITKI